MLKNQLIENIRHLSKDHIEGCKDCEYRYACYDCRPDSNGADKYAKPWNCSYDPYKGEWLDLKEMYKGLKKKNIKAKDVAFEEKNKTKETVCT